MRAIVVLFALGLSMAGCSSDRVSGPSHSGAEAPLGGYRLESAGGRFQVTTPAGELFMFSRAYAARVGLLAAMATRRSVDSMASRLSSPGVVYVGSAGGIANMEDTGIACATARTNFYAAKDAYDAAWAEFWHGVITYDLAGDASSGSAAMQDAFAQMKMWYQVGLINGCWSNGT